MGMNAQISAATWRSKVACKPQSAAQRESIGERCDSQILQRLVDVDQRKPGTQREVRYEITPAELIAAIRAHGAELPGESHGEAGK
jgi:hypothetical protein